MSIETTSTSPEGALTSQTPVAALGGAGRLILHIGTHKTGTTALQHALRCSPAELARVGYGFSYEWCNHPAMRAAMVSDEAADAGFTALQEAFAPIRQQLAQMRFILSSEGFCGRPRDGYEAAPRIAALLRRLCVGIEVEVIIYLRRQDAFLESLYTQTIHEGQSWSFAEYLAHTDVSAFDWHRLLSAYQQQFGREHVRVFAYEAAPARGGLIEHFLHTAGFQDGALIQGIEENARQAGAPVNRGYSPEILDFARVANAGLQADERVLLRRILQETLQVTKTPFASFSYFAPQQRTDLLNGFAEANSRLRTEYPEAGFEYWNRQPEVPTAPSSTEQTRTTLLLRLLLAQQVQIDRLVKEQKQATQRPSLRRALGRLFRSIAFTC